MTDPAFTPGLPFKAEEREVTQEMIEAGIEAWKYTPRTGDVARTVTAIYRAMRRLEP